MEWGGATRSRSPSSARVEPKRRIPRNNVLFVGALALIGSQVISFERGVELLNFGALLAFMGVNAAAFTRYFLREQQKKWTNFVLPGVGFLSLPVVVAESQLAREDPGATWVLAGIAYGAYRTRGFQVASWSVSRFPRSSETSQDRVNGGPTAFPIPALKGPSGSAGARAPGRL